MNTVTKLGLGAALVGLLFWVGNRAVGVNTLVQSLKFKLIDVGLPKIAGALVSIPLVARITNSSNESLAIDRLRLVVSYLNANNQYVPTTRADVSGFTIIPGSVDKQLTAQLDLRSLTKDFFDTVLNTLTTRQIQLRIDVTPTVKGVDLPTQSIFQSVRV